MDSFIMASQVVIPMAMMVAIGMLLRIINLTDAPTMKKVDKLIFNVFMPMLSFYNIYKTDFSKLTNVAYILFGCVLLIVLFVGISMGATIKVSQYFGARDKEGLSYTIGNSFTLTIAASIAVMILGMAVSRPLLILLKTPDSILDWCTSYLHIIFISI